MDIYEEILKLKGLGKKVPCLLCKKDSYPTVIGQHFKCGDCDHLFNEDSSLLPEGVECHCETCAPRPAEMVSSVDSKLLSKLKKKISSVGKKLKRKKK